MPEKASTIRKETKFSWDARQSNDFQPTVAKLSMPAEGGECRISDRRCAFAPAAASFLCALPYHALTVSIRSATRAHCFGAPVAPTADSSKRAGLVFVLRRRSGVDAHGVHKNTRTRLVYVRRRQVREGGFGKGHAVYPRGVCRRFRRLAKYLWLPPRQGPVCRIFTTRGCSKKVFQNTYVAHSGSFPK